MCASIVWPFRVGCVWAQQLDSVSSLQAVGDHSGVQMPSKRAHSPALFLFALSETPQATVETLKSRTFKEYPYPVLISIETTGNMFLFYFFVLFSAFSTTLFGGSVKQCSHFRQHVDGGDWADNWKLTVISTNAD
jgi:hypothetical protein